MCSTYPEAADFRFFRLSALFVSVFLIFGTGALFADGPLSFAAAADSLQAEILADSADSSAYAGGIAGCVALNENGTVRLIHASSSQGAVVIEKRALTLQLRENRRFTGIRIIRPLNVTARK